MKTEEVQAYIRQIADSLGLKDWAIEYKGEEPKGDNCNGEQWTPYGQKSAIK